MADKSVNIEFVGDAGGLISAINASVNAMTRMESQSKGFAGSIVNSVKGMLAPIAAAVAGAFAAKKALGDFAESNLPGAKEFKSTISTMQSSLKRLSETIGEYLAPMATRLAQAITWIADKLAPLVRIVTAFVASSGDFLKALGSNFLAALRTLMPTVFGFIDSIVAKFSGETDWDAVFGKIREVWNNTWNAILEFTAPIIAAIASLVETTITLLVAVFKDFKISLPGAPEAGGIAAMAGIIQTGLLTAILAVEFAIKNWRLSFDIAQAAGEVAVHVLISTFDQFAGYLPNLFTTIGENAATALNFYGGEIGKNFSSVFESIKTGLSELGRAFNVVGYNIYETMRATFEAIGKTALNSAIRIATAPARIAGLIASGIVGAGAIAGAINGEFEKQFPLLNTPKPSYLKIPGFSAPGALPGIGQLPDGSLKPLPGLPDRNVSDGERSARTALSGFLNTFEAQFGPELRSAIEKAMKEGGAFADAIRNGLPSVNAVPGARLAGASQGGTPALEFGTAAAFAAERNKQPVLEALAKEQVEATKDVAEAVRQGRAAKKRPPVIHI